MAAVCGGRGTSIAAAMQLQHQLDGLGPGYDDSVLLGAACKRNHRFNDPVAFVGDDGRYWRKADVQRSTHVCKVPRSDMAPRRSKLYRRRGTNGKPTPEQALQKNYAHATTSISR